MEKEYWFLGDVHKTYKESELTERQKQIIEESKSRICDDNLSSNWLGVKNEKEESWKFVRHGLEIIIIREEKGNIARKLLSEKLRDIYI